MVRLLAAMAVISLGGVLPLEFWPVHGVLMSAMWGAAAVCGARFVPMLRRLLVFLPFVLAIGLGVPATQDGDWPWAWSLTIVCRALVAFFAGMWLVHALPFPELLSALQRGKAPAVFVRSLAFMHRYSVVLWEELARLQRARTARSRRLGRLRSWTSTAQLIGELLLRAWDRAERVHRAMLARGGETNCGSTKAAR